MWNKLIYTLIIYSRLFLLEILGMITWIESLDENSAIQDNQVLKSVHKLRELGMGKHSWKKEASMNSYSNSVRPEYPYKSAI